MHQVEVVLAPDRSSIAYGTPSDTGLVAPGRWNELSPGVRRALVVAGAIEGILKIAALIDLRRRDPAEVHGSKKLWAVAVVVINSAGLAPLAYFFLGRRRTD
jgi:hypothetical protein